MGNFNREGGGFGNRGGGRSFGGGSRGGFGGGRDRGRPDMHSAICSECGRECEVPFRPTGDKPVYCSDCFKNQGGGNRGDRGGRDRGGFGGDRRDRGGRSDFGEKRTYKAVCAECGNECEVPFKPTGEKPVYCNNCFGKDDGGFKPKKTDENRQEFDRLNTKLDRIIKALEAAGLKKPDAVVKPVTEEKKEEIKEFSSKKPAEKKKTEKKEEKPAKLVQTKTEGSKVEEKPAAKKAVKAKKKSK
jgi:CxxC-x17-CxxC domain-containing protein